MEKHARLLLWPCTLPGAPEKAQKASHPSSTAPALDICHLPLGRTWSEAQLSFAACFSRGASFAVRGGAGPLHPMAQRGQGCCSHRGWRGGRGWPTHLVQHQLLSNVVAHSSPDGHGHCKARQRNVLLWVGQRPGAPSLYSALWLAPAMGGCLANASWPFSRTSCALVCSPVPPWPPLAAAARGSVPPGSRVGQEQPRHLGWHGLTGTRGQGPGPRGRGHHTGCPL